ncbi:hypothetical protein RJ639_039000 [Escallonia herrerae]|uniref:Nucleolar protein 10 n=1 Tax=Escallonia herrerae TaxID=1293975 RepID=A0AA89B3H7_9ASTE|nr:hypothetical protein RJ639_039000 [Escallonia herrerae]
MIGIAASFKVYYASCISLYVYCIRWALALTSELACRKNHLSGSLYNLLIQTSPCFLQCVARFSPDDKYARQRVLLKKRFGLLPTQKPPPKY